MFVWLEDIQTMRDVWKCVSMDTGDTSVIIGWIPQALWLCASSCLEKTLVRWTIIFICCSSCFSICVFLLFPAAVPFSYGVFGSDTGKNMLYSISCTGSPSRLVDCSYSLGQGYSFGGCYHYEDAGVRCYGKPAIVTLLLILHMLYPYFSSIVLYHW